MNESLKKILVAPCLIVVACLVAGLYGSIHNQVSYTVSPEYFTQFKFHQFNIVDKFPDRVGAAIVGFLAAWWMGILISMFLVPIGIVIKGFRSYCSTVVGSFIVVAMTALVTGMVGLMVGIATVQSDVEIQKTKFDTDIQDDVAFLWAGSMHNFSYLGGAIGLIAGVVYILVVRYRPSKKLLALSKDD